MDEVAAYQISTAVGGVGRASWLELETLLLTKTHYVIQGEQYDVENV